MNRILIPCLLKSSRNPDAECEYDRGTLRLGHVMDFDRFPVPLPNNIGCYCPRPFVPALRAQTRSLSW